MEEAGLTRFELEGDSRCVRAHQALGPCAPQREVNQLFDELGHMKLDTPDRTFSEFLGQRNLAQTPWRWRPTMSKVSTRPSESHQRAVPGETTGGGNAIEGDRLFRVAEGYAAVPAFLLRRFLDAGGEWVSSCPVRSIGWKPGRVEVATASNRAFHAAAAIITLPLGVLQARGVSFVPQPREILDAADRLAMGPVARVVYEFDPRFWDRFASLVGVSFSLLRSSLPLPGGPQPPAELFAHRLGSRPQSWQLKSLGLPEAGLATLAYILGCSTADIRQYLVRWHLHDWQADVLQPGGLHVRSARRDPGF